MLSAALTAAVLVLMLRLLGLNGEAIRRLCIRLLIIAAGIGLACFIGFQIWNWHDMHRTDPIRLNVRELEFNRVTPNEIRLIQEVVQSINAKPLTFHKRHWEFLQQAEPLVGWKAYIALEN